MTRDNAWSPTTRLSPWNASIFAILQDCRHLHQLVSSLPSDDADDVRWASPWADYVDAVYGSGTARHIDARTLQFIRGVALRNASHSVVDRKPWTCVMDGMTYQASNVRAQGTRAVVIWHTSGAHSPSAYAADHKWIEVYRTTYDDFAGGEGLGYGCWFHRARGTGMGRMGRWQ